MLPPEKMLTAFNRRVYTVLLEYINAEKAFNLTDISGEFRDEELAAIAGMMAKTQELTIRREDVEEYIHIIQWENDKLRVEQTSVDAPGDIQEYLNNLKSRKK